MRRVWTGVLVNTLAAAGPLMMQQNPGRVLCEFANEARNVSTNRGAIYLAYAAFFFIEGVLILLFPSETLKARHTCVLPRATSAMALCRDMAPQRCWRMRCHLVKACAKLKMTCEVNA